MASSNRVVWGAPYPPPRKVIFQQRSEEGFGECTPGWLQGKHPQMVREGAGVSGQREAVRGPVAGGVVEGEP